MINVVAVVPVLFLEGLSGSFFRPLVLSYGLAVLVSMVVALTVTPALCLLMLSRGALVSRESPLLRVLKRGYGAALGFLVRRPAPAFVTTGVLFLAGIVTFPLLGSQLLPNFKERDFLMHWLTQPGTSVTEETRISVLGLQGPAPDPRRTQLRLPHRPGLPRRRGLRRGLRRELDQRQPGRRLRRRPWTEVQHTVDRYPGLYRDVQTYLRERIKEVLTGTSESVVVRIYGPDLATLQEQSKIVEERLVGIEGLVDAHASFQTDLAHIEVEVNLAEARKYGLTSGDVRRQASTMIASEEVSDIFHGGRAYDVHVTAIPEARDSFTDVENMPIDTPSGDRVRLGDIATIRMAPDPERDRAGQPVAAHRRRRKPRGP